MRELLFRGKSKDANPIWLTGGYCSRAETTYCVTSDYAKNPVPVHHYIAVDSVTDWGLPNELRLFEVIPESIGQYAGCADKNGRDLFEGDLVKSGKNTGTICFGVYSDLSGTEHVGFYIDWNGDKKTLLRPDLPYWAEKCECTGNEYDARNMGKGEEQSYG